MLTETQKKTIELLGLTLLPEQEQILTSSARIKLIAGGERGSKSFTNALILVSEFLDGDLYWLVGDDYESCRGEWNHLVEWFTKLALVTDITKNIDPGKIKLISGAEIITKSAKYPTKIATTAPDGILVCEAAQIDYETYLRLRGRLAEKRAWMSMAGTFESSLGWYPELFTRWQSTNNEEARSFSLPTWINTVIFPGGRKDPEILRLEQQTTPERFQERYGGLPCPPTGLVIKEFSNAVHVGWYWWDADIDIELAIDPGYAGAYCVLAIQKWGEQIIVVDEVYLQGYVTEEIIDICKQKPWWAKVKGGAIDIAARQHQAMDAPIEIWLKKTGIHLRSTKVTIEDGINVLRTYLKVNPITLKPMILVNAVCKGFIAECGGGKSPVDELPIPGRPGHYEHGGHWMRDPNTLKPIDKNNHACKSLIYYLVNKFGYTGRSKITPMTVTGTQAKKTYVRT